MPEFDIEQLETIVCHLNNKLNQAFNDQSFNGNEFLYRFGLFEKYLCLLFEAVEHNPQKYGIKEKFLDADVLMRKVYEPLSRELIERMGRSKSLLMFYVNLVNNTGEQKQKTLFVAKEASRWWSFAEIFITLGFDVAREEVGVIQDSNISTGINEIEQQKTNEYAGYLLSLDTQNINVLLSAEIALIEELSTATTLAEKAQSALAEYKDLLQRKQEYISLDSLARQGQFISLFQNITAETENQQQKYLQVLWDLMSFQEQTQAIINFAQQKNLRPQANYVLYKITSDNNSLSIYQNRFLLLKSVFETSGQFNARVFNVLNQGQKQKLSTFDFIMREEDLTDIFKNCLRECLKDTSIHSSLLLNVFMSFEKSIEEVQKATQRHKNAIETNRDSLERQLAKHKKKLENRQEIIKIVYENITEPLKTQLLNNLKLSMELSDQSIYKTHILKANTAEKALGLLYAQISPKERQEEFISLQTQLSTVGSENSEIEPPRYVERALGILYAQMPPKERLEEKQRLLRQQSENDQTNDIQTFYTNNPYEKALLILSYVEKSRSERVQEAFSYQLILSKANLENCEDAYVMHAINLAILYAQMPTEERLEEEQRLQRELGSANSEECDTSETAEKALGILYKQMSQNEKTATVLRLQLELSTADSENNTPDTTEKALGILYAQMPTKERLEEEQKLQNQIEEARQKDYSVKATEKAFLILSYVAMSQDKRTLEAQKLRRELRAENQDDSIYKTSEKALGILYAQMSTEDKQEEFARLQENLSIPESENHTVKIVEKALDMLYVRMSQSERKDTAEKLRQKLNTTNQTSSEKALSMLYAQMLQSERTVEAQKLQGELRAKNQDDSIYKTSEKALSILYAQMLQSERTVEVQRLQEKLSQANQANAEKVLGILYAQMPQSERTVEAQRLQGELMSPDYKKCASAKKELSILYSVINNKQETASEMVSVFNEINVKAQGVYVSFKQHNNYSLPSENENHSQAESKIDLIQTDDFQNATVEQQVQYTVDVMYYLGALQVYLELYACKPMLMDSEVEAIDIPQKSLFDSLTSLQQSLKQMPASDGTTNNNQADITLPLSQNIALGY